ncbi:MAG: hypothetical protein ISS12_07135 [Candidatus Marinimicrobia bacterium]|nr:hypothetical protein [FCB group bacterium]MBL7121744.1 hypothetical protein [Candidatus Neomarinimicrobiota bacterium]
MNDQLTNHTESAEVSGNDQQTSNEQEGGENMNAKTRQPYDGRYAHGVTADTDHIKTIIDYDNAVDRLSKRRTYLIGEYKQIASKYEATPDVSVRAKLLKSKAVKEAQIKAVTKTSESLSSIKSEIEEAEREAQAAVEFTDFDAV